MSSERNPGRTAGLIYLLLVVCAPLRLFYIPSQLFVSGDAAATARNIAEHELLFRLGILADLTCGVTVVLLSLALYRLFQGVNRNAAVLVVLLGGVIPGAIDFINTVNDGAALMLIRGADFLSVFDESQRYALAFLFIRLHHQVIVGGRSSGDSGSGRWRSSRGGRASCRASSPSGSSSTAPPISSSASPPYWRRITKPGSSTSRHPRSSARWRSCCGS